jgi:hypothetical protein
MLRVKTASSVETEESQEDTKYSPGPVEERIVGEKVMESDSR